MLTEPEQECDCGHDHEHAHDQEGCACGHDHDHGDEDGTDVYIMKVVQRENDVEEFIPVDDELADKLIEIVQSRFDEEDAIDDEEDE